MLSAPDGVDYQKSFLRLHSGWYRLSRCVSRLTTADSVNSFVMFDAPNLFTVYSAEGTKHGATFSFKTSRSTEPPRPVLSFVSFNVLVTNFSFVSDYMLDAVKQMHLLQSNTELAFV